MTDVTMERFFKKVKYSKSGCWNWTASKSKLGYGRFGFLKKNWYAHRWLFLKLNPKLDHSKLVLHSCNNPSCVRPDHLYLGTYSDNTKDSIRAGSHPTANKPHCRNGHKRTKKNTYIDKRTGWKNCRDCWALKRGWANIE